MQNIVFYYFASFCGNFFYFLDSPHLIKLSFQDGENEFNYKYNILLFY